jgi:hypothetical protein
MQEEGGKSALSKQTEQQFSKALCCPHEYGGSFLGCHLFPLLAFLVQASILCIQVTFMPLRWFPRLLPVPKQATFHLQLIF